MKTQRKVCFATLLTGTLLLIAQPSFANGGQNGFRDFKAANPGINGGALRHMWRQSRNPGDGPSGTFGICPIFPGSDRGGVPHTALPVNNVNNGWCKPMVPDFSNKANGASINPPLNVDPGTRPTITWSQFKDLNVGISHKALKSLYKGMQNGDGGITIGFIPGLPTDAHTHPPINVNLTTPVNDVNLITGR